MPIKNKKIFISGAMGFIGSHLIERLAPENEITAFDSGLRNALAYVKKNPKWNLRIIESDILDKTALHQAMSGSHIVIHLAAIAGVSSYYRTPVRTMLVNMLGTANILEGAKILGIEKFINFATSEIYGSHAFNVNEDDITKQGPSGQLRWTYSVSKLAGEHLCMAYFKEHGLPVVSIRPFNIYGPRQVGEGAISNFIRRSLDGEELRVEGEGYQIRSWCYVSDLVEATIRTLENPEAIGKSFNIGNPRATLTTLELARKVKTIAHSPSLIAFAPPPKEKVHLRIPSIERAQKILNYAPHVDLEEGLKRTIQWFRQSYQKLD